MGMAIWLVGVVLGSSVASAKFAFGWTPFPDGLYPTIKDFLLFV